MSKHSPGPWTIGKVSHAEQHVDIDSLNHDPFVGCDEWRTMARTYGTEGEEEIGSIVMLANARLIAAAPELLEALKLALEYWRHRQQRYKNRSPVWVQAARAAITKATGEQA